MSDQEIKNWDQRLKDQVKKGWDNYVRRRIDLAIAQVDEFWAVAGEFLYVEEVSSASAAASIRINRNTNDGIDLRAGVKIATVFKEFYITNDAQAGEWIDLIIGINFAYYKPLGASSGDAAYARQVVNLTHANPNTNVTPAAQICSRVCIKADVNNTDIAWIDFGAASVQNDAFPLDPGESVTVGISNLDQINANFEVGGEIVYLLYEV